MPDASTAAAKRLIVTRRIARALIRVPNFAPNHARAPLAVPTVPIAVTMHCRHIVAGT
jgi:hypothetical protein